VFFFLSRLAEIALAPLTWVVALFAIALFRAARAARAARAGRRGGGRRARRRGLLPALAALAILYVFSLPPVANGLVRSLERSAADTTGKDVTYDAVIVLGGVLSEKVTESWGGEPQLDDSVERVLAAFQMLRTGRARNVLVSAGTPDRNVAPDSVEARVVARQLAAWGIEGDRIFVEDRSRNTHENALYSEPIVRAQGWRTLVLVTSAFHMARAAGCFRAVGLSFDTLPVDYRSYDPSRFHGGVLPKADQLATSTMAIHEYVGRLAYRLSGYTKD
jgi:uncharacterized SAM-binding protein YcdF (DUF218 family)